MVQRSRTSIRRGVERQVERRLGDVELRVPGFVLDGLDAEEGSVEADRLVELGRVEGDVHLHAVTPFRAETGTRPLRVQHSAYRNANRSRNPAASAR